MDFQNRLRGDKNPRDGVEGGAEKIDDLDGFPEDPTVLRKLMSLFFRRMRDPAGRGEGGGEERA